MKTTRRRDLRPIAIRCEILAYHWAKMLEALEAGDEAEAAHHRAIWEATD